MTTRILLTGHSRGLGAALAQQLLACGHSVLALGRSPNPALATAHPQRLREVLLNLADSSALARWLDGGSLHTWLADADQAVLINNAGLLQPVAPAGRQGHDAISRAIAVNLSAPLILADAFVAASGHCTDRRIVHVSSGAARNAYAGWSIYGATKAGLDQHARSTALDRIVGLRIASLAPGVVDTDMQAEVRHSSEASFPQQARFVALKEEGQLTPPTEAARRLLDHLFGDNFGCAVDGDLRTL